MYQIELLKQSALVKQLGGPPIFHDGFLRRISIDKNTMILEIKILSQNNPLIQSDSLVALKLNTLHSFSLQANTIKNNILVIRDIDIRKEGKLLHLILETEDNEFCDVIFETIELEPIIKQEK